MTSIDRPSMAPITVSPKPLCLAGWLSLVHRSLAEAPRFLTLDSVAARAPGVSFRKSPSTGINEQHCHRLNAAARDGLLSREPLAHGPLSRMDIAASEPHLLALHSPRSVGNGFLCRRPPRPRRWPDRLPDAGGTAGHWETRRRCRRAEPPATATAACERCS